MIEGYPAIELEPFELGIILDANAGTHYFNKDGDNAALGGSTGRDSGHGYHAEITGHQREQLGKNSFQAKPLIRCYTM